MVATQICTALIVIAVTSSNGEEFLVVDNFNYGGEIYGTRDDMVDYVTLAEDPISNLSSSFTICSSIQMRFLVTSQPFFILWSENLDVCLLNLIIYFQRRTDPFSEHFFANAGFESGLSKLNFGDVHVPIIPHSWYHACLGVNTLQGSFRVVVNGLNIYDKTVEPL